MIAKIIQWLNIATCPGHSYEHVGDVYSKWKGVCSIYECKHCGKSITTE